jgi:hypothetical protein
MNVDSWNPSRVPIHSESAFNGDLERIEEVEPAMQSSKTVPAETLEQLRADREAIAAELPEAIQRSERLREAAVENTMSGRLRRAVHQSRCALDTIARDAGIPVELLCDWLAGDRTLRSDVLDRVAQAVGAEMSITLRPR